MQITKGLQPRPRRVLLYGQHGVGKSSWAAGAPRPLFLNCEDGLADIDCEATSLVKSIGDVNNAISWLLNEKHDYKTVVVDTADWFEAMLLKTVAQEFGKTTYEEIEFGRGKGRAIVGWQWLLSQLDVLRNHRRMAVVLLSHSRIEKFENPSGASYDRYVPDLHKISFGLVQEWVDEVLFACFRVLTTEIKEEWGAKRSVAVGGKERYILTSESAASMAKNRLRLPDELPMDWKAYQAYWPKMNGTPATATPEAGNIAGAVVEGSSKVAAV